MSVSDIPSPWQHQFLATNQIQLHCVTQGEGDLVLLLHGFPEFWYSWRYQIPVLARHFKVVVPDLRGCNDSDKPQQGYDLDTLSQDIQGLIASLGYQRAHIVGHDWGGLVAWHLAQIFPQSLDRLVILNAPHPHQLLRGLLSNLDQLGCHWHLFASQFPGLPEWLIQRHLKGFVENLFQQQSTRKGAFSPETLQIYQAALEKAGVLTAVSHCYRQFLAPQVWLRNGAHAPLAIAAPTLVLWGKDDQRLSPWLIQGLEQIVRAPWRCKLIPECGHWIQQEVPGIVNREILNFLQQIPNSKLMEAG